MRSRIIPLHTPFTWVLLASLTAALWAGDSTTLYRAKSGSGSLVRIEGTSTIHDWTVEGLIIGGSLEVDPNVLFDRTASSSNEVPAKAELMIPVRSLKSVKNGKGYSTKMDDIMYEHLKITEHPRIVYTLSKLVRDQQAQDDQTHGFIAEGKLSVAGVTNTISMPVTMARLDDQQLKIHGAITLKMTEYGVEPPSPTGLGYLIKTGAEVKLTIDWVIGQR